MGHGNSDSNCCVNRPEMRNIRKAQNLSISQVAELSGISKTSIWKMEAYKYGIRLCDFIKLMNKLGLTITITDKEGNISNILHLENPESAVI